MKFSIKLRWREWWIGVRWESRYDHWSAHGGYVPVEKLKDGRWVHTDSTLWVNLLPCVQITVKKIYRYEQQAEVVPQDSIV